jgi:hypothetical protein
MKDILLGAEILYTRHHSWNNGQNYTGTTGDSFKPFATYGLRDNGFLSGLLSARLYF